jgi:hypothetical protein
MDGVKAKGGSIFAAAQASGNLDGLEFTGDAVRSVAERLAATQLEKAKKKEEDVQLRADAAVAMGVPLGGGKGKGGRGRGRGRTAWKQAAAELARQHRAAQMRIRELEAALEASGVATGGQGEGSTAL